jgi:hypothetical protein
MLPAPAISIEEPSHKEMCISLLTAEAIVGKSSSAGFISGFGDGWVRGTLEPT